MIRDWGKIHDEKITCMFHQRHTKELFTSAEGPSVKRWSLKPKNYGELLKDHSKFLEETLINSIVVNYHGNILFYSDSNFMRKMCLKTGKYYELYDEHKADITHIIMAYPSEYKKYWEAADKFIKEEKNKNFSPEDHFTNQIKKHREFKELNSISSDDGLSINFTSLSIKNNPNKGFFDMGVVDENFVNNNSGSIKLTKTTSTRQISSKGVEIPYLDKTKSSKDILTNNIGLSPRNNHVAKKKNSLDDFLTMKHNLSTVENPISNETII